MRRRVMFVGGPLDGQRDRVPAEEVGHWIGYSREQGSRVHVYQGAIARTPKGSFYIRYTFMGHDFTEEDVERCRSNG